MDCKSGMPCPRCWRVGVVEGRYASLQCGIDAQLHVLLRKDVKQAVDWQFSDETALFSSI
jgi:hypothetical protein